MQISDLTTIPQAPANVDVMAIEVGGVTYKVNKQTLASAILGQIGASDNVVDVSHGGTGATTAAAARTALGILPSDYTIYNGVTDLGLTSGSATITGAFNAMAANTILICPVEEFASAERPTEQGTIEIVKPSNAARTYIRCYGKTWKHYDWRMFLNTSNVPSGEWRLDGQEFLNNTTVTGTTINITVPSGSSHILIVSGTSQYTVYIGYVKVSNAGVTSAADILKGTRVSSVTGGTNTVSITLSSSDTVSVMCIPILGAPFTNVSAT